MTSPRHLWSGDWRRDSDAAAAELAKRRAAEGGAAAEGETTGQATPAPPPRVLRPRPPESPRVDRSETATQPLTRARAPTPPPRVDPRPPKPPRAETRPPKPPREPLGKRVAAALRRARERIPAFGHRERRLALLVALGAFVLAGAAYGLAQIGGSGASTPSSAVITGRPWLGLEVSMPPGGGVIVDSVAPRGPAQRAGIAPGDVILQIGNTPVSATGDVKSAIQGMHPGQSVPITVLRGASSYTTLAILTGAPAGSGTP